MERAGFEHVGVFEFDRNAAATLRTNRPDWKVIEGDIKTLDFRPYHAHGVDLVAGGLPCQRYSSEGYGLGKDDPRDLFPDAVRIVKEIKPKAFLFENVEGLLHGKHSDHIADVLRAFRKVGYQTEIHRIQAGDLGIAQVRRRVLVVGLRHDIADAFRMPPAFPARRLNIGNALVDLMAANGWDGAHAWARQRAEQPVFDRSGDLVAYGAQASTVVTGSGKRRRNEKAVQKAMGYDTTGAPDQAPTAEEASKPGSMPSLTLRMRARLQNFDDDWRFEGGKQAMARQIGNAVPPRLAQAVGMSLYSAISGVQWDWEAALWPNEDGRTTMEAPPLQMEVGEAEDISAPILEEI
ncbi:MAG: DNA (cytosine-5-)-methyltransferase [Rhizobium sp.]|nr:DNA (cytosine-5-)-methyltransferase [Rhizobium sp.]